MASRLIALVLLALPAMSAEATAAGRLTSPAAIDTTVPVDDSTPETTVNPFMPERENVSECFGGVPRPDCGSEARGGWRQGLVFGAVAVAMVVVGVRLALGVRKRANPSA